MGSKKWRVVTAILLSVTMVFGCGVQTQEISKSHRETKRQEKEKEQETKVPKSAAASVERPLFVKFLTEKEEERVVPGVEPYTVEKDLSNLDNLWQFYFEGEAADKLVQNGFVVRGGAGSEFFEIYESNRYSQIPNFITVDSMMHTYHLYFSYLLKNTEREYLADSIEQLSKRMLADSIEQYEKLKGSEWESAAKRNVAFFTVGAKLSDDSVSVLTEAADVVSYELAKINGAAGIDESQITGDLEDYSQYKPRGYYEGDEKLEDYFKTMMWYGRISFRQEQEDLDRSALLITKALKEDKEAYRLWEAVYAVTSFFAGASDDLGFYEYVKVLDETYDDRKTEELIGKERAFTAFHKKTASLSLPKINSLPIEDGEDNVIRGFRFMGQRFTIDAAIMQKLVYQSVKENRQGVKRMLPDVLDIPAALGSDTARRILEQNGATDYKGYSSNMNKLKKGLAEADDTLWTASLYANWLHTLRPLLEDKGEGYPVFMQKEEWNKKNLECFAGSFTELKHDTILYAKQVMAEMGGGWEEEPDDRGYVEPEPLVYERFANLADMTAQGLKKYEMLSAADEENLSRLSQLARQLQKISNKELTEETLTEEEYELIRSYGGNLEHFWYETMKNETVQEGSEFGGMISSQEFPAAIVVDIATDPNGTVLEAATGNPSEIIAAVKVDGKLKLASGSVYTFYQFEQPLENRLTDTQWRLMMGLQADEEGYYNRETRIAQPSWTDSYRYRYDWE